MAIFYSTRFENGLFFIYKRVLTGLCCGNDSFDGTSGGGVLRNTYRSVLIQHVVVDFVYTPLSVKLGVSIRFVWRTHGRGEGMEDNRK